MYPINAASPQRIAVGAVVQISDGAVQTSAVSVSVLPQGGAAAAGGGTIAYEQGIVHYLPTQAETNYASFIVIAYKTGCIPVAVTVVTSASGTAGYAGVDWSKVTAPTTTLALTGTTIATTQKVDVETIKTNPVVNAGTVTFPTTATLASTTNITAGTITTVTNQLTAAQIATGVWTDTTAGDFTTALSIGKSVMNGVALGTGLTINAYTGNTVQTGDNFARLGAPAGASVSADVAAIQAKTTNLPAAPASTTNITAGTITTVTNLTNAPTAGDLTATMKTSVSTAVFTTAMTESYRTLNASPTFAQFAFETLSHLGSSAIVSTTKTIKKVSDGTTAAKTYTLDSATVPTSIVEAS